MTTYKCPRCEYETQVKCNMMKHLTRITACVPIDRDASGPTPPTMADALTAFTSTMMYEARTKSFECVDCKRMFTSASGLSRHRRLHCEVVRVEAELKERLELLEMELRALKSSRATSCNTTNNNTTNNNTTNNNTNNNTNNITINVVAFGNENPGHILADEAFMERCIRRRELGVVEYLEKLHFDPDHPEHHNVKATNYKMPWIETYDGKQWLKIDKNETLDNMVNEGCNTLDEHYQENKETYTQKLTNNMLAMIEDFLEKAQNGDPATFQDIKKRLCFTILNHSKSVSAKRSDGASTSYS